MRRAQVQQATASDAAATDLQQASQLLQSIVEQAGSMGSSFPLPASLLPLMSARGALLSGDRAGALVGYRAAISAEPLQVGLWEELAEVYSSVGAAQAAEACLLAPLELVQAAGKEGTLAQEVAEAGQLRLLLRLALHAVQNGSVPSSCAYATRAARECGTAGSSSVAAHLLMGIGQAASAHPDQASRALQTALNLFLSRADRSERGVVAASAGLAAPAAGLRFHLALLAWRRKDVDAAKAHLQTAQQLRPGNQLDTQLLDEIDGKTVEKWDA